MQKRHLLAEEILTVCSESAVRNIVRRLSIVPLSLA